MSVCLLGFQLKLGLKTNVITFIASVECPRKKISTEASSLLYLNRNDSTCFFSLFELHIWDLNYTSIVWSYASLSDLFQLLRKLKKKSFWFNRTAQHATRSKLFNFYRDSNPPWFRKILSANYCLLLFCVAFGLAFFFPCSDWNYGYNGSNKILNLFLRNCFQLSSPASVPFSTLLRSRSTMDVYNFLEYGMNGAYTPVLFTWCIPAFVYYDRMEHGTHFRKISFDTALNKNKMIILKWLSKSIFFIHIVAKKMVCKSVFANVFPFWMIIVGFYADLWIGRCLTSSFVKSIGNIGIWLHMILIVHWFSFWALIFIDICNHKWPNMNRDVKH